MPSEHVSDIDWHIWEVAWSLRTLFFDVSTVKMEPKILIFRRKTGFQGDHLLSLVRKWMFPIKSYWVKTSRWGDESWQFYAKFYMRVMFLVFIVPSDTLHGRYGQFFWSKIIKMLLQKLIFWFKTQFWKFLFLFEKWAFLAPFWLYLRQKQCP